MDDTNFNQEADLLCFGLQPSRSARASGLSFGLIGALPGVFFQAVAIGRGGIAAGRSHLGSGGA